MAKPALHTALKGALIGAWTVIFGAGYFRRFPLPGLIPHAFYLVIALLVLASAAGYGWRIVRRFHGDDLTIAEQALFAALTGFGLLSLGMMALGTLGLWTPWAASLLIAMGFLTGWTSWRNLSWKTMRWDDGMPMPLSWVPHAILALGLVLGLLIAFSPTTYYDSLVYHMALPQAYVRAGHWVGMPELIYSSFPQNLEMLWTLGLLLGGDVLANLVGWIIAVLGIAAVYLFGRRFLGTRTGLWAAAILATMPTYLLLGSGGYVDVGQAVFSFGSLYALALWPPARKPSLLAMAGFLAGIALGVKYTAGISCVLGALLIIHANGAEYFRRSWKDISVYGAFAALAFVPWLTKNLIFVGNPVFPFLHTWSLHHLNPWVGGAVEGYFRGLVEYQPRHPPELIRLLWDISVKGLDFGGGMDVLGDLGWGLLFGLLPFLALIPKRAKILPLLALYGTGFFVLWGMSRPVLRFLMPLVPILALLAGYAAVEGVPALGRYSRMAARGLILALWLSGIWLFFSVNDMLSLFKVPLGFQTPSAYLAQKLNYYAAARFLDRLPEGSLTYVVGDQRGYYYNKPVMVTPVFNTNPLTDWANTSASPQVLRDRMRQQGITHLLINHPEMERLNAAYHIFAFTPAGRAAWDGVRLHLAKPMYRDASCEVLAL